MTATDLSPTLGPRVVLDTVGSKPDPHLAVSPLQHRSFPARRGWCPGALRPMQSGDGLIVRLKLTGGILNVGLAQQIALWSRQWGNGQIDLTSRANLQLRGLSPRYLPDLQEALADAGLLDLSEAGEAVRNVISSPLAGLDPDAELDIRPVTKCLEHRITGDVSLSALPGKFGFAIDDGGCLGLDGDPADIRFVSRRGLGFTAHLSGVEPDCIGPFSPGDVGDVAVTLARVFLRFRAPSISRMRDLIATVGGQAVAREAGLAHTHRRHAARISHASQFLGAHPLGAAGFVGIGLPFGRIDAECLAELASAAAAVGGNELRLTAWRAILLPVPSLAAARALSVGLVRDSLILSPLDARLRIAACVGAPSCERATTSVREHAASLAASAAALGQSDITIHVSGCEKGCAHPRAAPFTLVGRDGRYDLVRNGTAATSPVPRGRGLTFEQAAQCVGGNAE
jgi:precorrin-3B synthase